MKRIIRLKKSFMDSLGSSSYAGPAAAVIPAAENAEAEQAGAGEQFYFDSFEVSSPDQGVGTPSYCL